MLYSIGWPFLASSLCVLVCTGSARGYFLKKLSSYPLTTQQSCARAEGRIARYAIVLGSVACQDLVMIPENEMVVVCHRSSYGQGSRDSKISATPPWYRGHFLMESSSLARRRKCLWYNSKSTQPTLMMYARFKWHSVKTGAFCMHDGLLSMINPLSLQMLIKTSPLRA